MPMPTTPKIYHIVHVDRLTSIMEDKYLWCDAEIERRSPPGTTIGMSKIKDRRLNELKFTSHPHLYVGDCVPFYFCPRSIMLFMIHKDNHPELSYHGGQEQIIHLEADLYETVEWAEHNGRLWVFTFTNAGSRYFEDSSDLNQLDKIDWAAVKARHWQNCKEGKQAEFLIEHSFPWELVQHIGVRSHQIYTTVATALRAVAHKPSVQIKPDWYY